MTENKNEETKRDWAEGNIKTIKFLAVCLCAFLGGLLAVFLINTIIPPRSMQPEFFPEPPRNHIDMPDDFMGMHPDMPPTEDFVRQLPNAEPIAKAPFHNSVANLEELPDKCKLYINLKRFNNDEKNVNVKITKHSIKISGKAEINKNGEQSSFVYKNNLVLPKEIKVDKVTKELVHNKLIYTLPTAD